MALQVQQFVVTIPAGTPITAPAVIELPLDNWEIESLDLEVPPGPAGLMGFHVANNGVQWLPRGAGTWLVWDDRAASWNLTGQPNAGGWQVVGYNTGTYDHAVIARFHVNPPAAAADGAPPPAVTIVTSDLPEPATVLL